ncbi:MAG TPA: dihydrodipicolinate reductase, partial [Myxococcales bacterium]|nr:dihydrodipicolinate reductase [Myxococcales bacterium]
MAIKVALMGLGAIGRGIARCALQKPDLEIVAAIDLDPKRVGKKLSDVVDAPCPEVIIGSDAAAEMKKAQGGVLLHATGSRLDRVEGELAQALTAGLCVVSTCEELSYPWLRHPEIAERLDKLAQKRKLALLGTGVNPGFVMDRLPATLGAVCGPVERVHVKRVVDSRTRRKQLQL